MSRLEKGHKAFHVPYMGGFCSLVCLLGSLATLLSGCEKEVAGSQKVYSDDFKDTSNIELSFDTTRSRKNDFSIEHEDGLVKFHAYGSGRVLGRVKLSEHLPDLSDHREVSIRIELEKFSGYNNEFGGGPILSLRGKSEAFYFAPGNLTHQDHVYSEALEGTRSLTFHIDQSLGKIRVVRDQSQEVRDYFLGGNPLEGGELTLVVGADSNNGISGPLEANLYLERIEIFTP